MNLLRLKAKTVADFERVIEVIKPIKHADELFIQYKFNDEVMEWRLDKGEWENFCLDHDILDFKTIVSTRLNGSFDKEDIETEAKAMAWDNMQLTPVTSTYYVALHEYSKSLFWNKARRAYDKLCIPMFSFCG